ncbi:hypothetical protein [Shewanella sp. UCD-KL12]|uniref:hypothetical protein n=1 Tax=Shewanella sp. UCD-KL12 TaxID=1917163 RepID=UPI0009707D98|nr:hypothetical protein [Shewanella sp. UCD-KL12]
MQNISFQYSLSDKSLSELLAFKDFEWPEAAHSCIQLTDGEVIFLSLSSQNFNNLRFQNESQCRFTDATVLQMVKSVHCVYVEGGYLLLLDEIAVDWCVATTKEKILLSLLTVLSRTENFENGLLMCMEKLSMLGLSSAMTKHGLLISLASGTEYLIPKAPDSSEFHFIIKK